MIEIPENWKSRWCAHMRRMGRGREKTEICLALILIAIVALSIACLAASRSYFGFGTETDYLGGILEEAYRFENGEPLLSKFHPPLYPIAIALLNSTIEDWFATGRILSVISAAICLTASFFFYRSVLSQEAGLGSVIALGLSPVFVSYSAFATTDIFFAALFAMTILLAYVSDRRNSFALWGFTGVVVGCALLTRSNALTLALVLATPWLAFDASMRRRLMFFASALGGVCVPLAVCLAYAWLTGSNVFPTEGTSVNLGLSFFMPEGVTEWADAVPFGEQHFGSTLDVLTYDPVRLLTVYLKGLYNTLELVLQPNSLLAFPVSHFALAGIVYLFFIAPRKWIVIAALLIVAQILLVNFKHFEPRYYVFVVPFIGALAGEFARRVYWVHKENGAWPQLRKVGYVVLIALLLIGIRHTITTTLASVHRDEWEVAESVPVVRELVRPNAFIVSRKPLLRYYTKATWIWMPNGKSVESLRAYVNEFNSSGGKAIFIYYGSAEARLRPEYRELFYPDKIEKTLPMFEVVAQGSDAESWVLYKLAPN